MKVVKRVVDAGKWICILLRNFDKAPVINTEAPCTFFLTHNDKRGIQRTGGGLNDAFCEHFVDLVLNDFSLGWRHPVCMSVHGKISSGADAMSDGRRLSEWSISGIKKVTEG